MNKRISLKYEDFGKVCRLCCETSKDLTPIFHKTEENINNFWNDDSTGSVVAAMLIKIGLIVKRSDGLPTTLCSDCHAKLLNSNTFREQCISSEAYLRDILVKHNDNVQVKSETTDDDIGNLNDSEINYLDEKEVDITDGHIFANGSVEAFEITLKNETTTEVIVKRKRGRPRTRVDKPPTPTPKQSRSVVKSKPKKKKPKSVICLICGKVINHNIKGHQAIHDKSETYKCDICGFTTNVKLYLQNHMRQSHIAKRQYPCPHCHLIFMHSVTLKRHSTIHTGERNYVCESCGKSYRQREMLKAHMKRHQVPTIPCPFCDKLFHTKNALKSHTGLHTGIKAFKCDICTAAFSASSSLAAHRRQHKKDNVLPSCKFCGKSFNDRTVYNMHLMDHKRENQSIVYNSKEKCEPL